LQNCAVSFAVDEIMTTSARIVIALTAIAIGSANAQCNGNIFSKSCQQSLRQQNENLGKARPDFESKKCDYEDQKFYLIPQEADNITCTRPDVIAEGVKVVIFNDSVVIKPDVVVLPSCFEIEFTMEITADINEVPKSMLAKNEFQLYEFAEIEKMQCQNATNNGCGGYGNNCQYCDMCESLTELSKDASAKTDRVQSQFGDLKCPNKAGQRFKVKREFCFNDWSEMDKDQNCRLDMLEDLAKDSSKDYDTIDEAFKLGNNKGSSTLLARFYLATNETDAQRAKRLAKEAEISQHADSELSAKRAAGWEISDTDFAQFKTWFTQNEKDKWHKEKFLPWLLFENQLACLKVSFTVCEDPPIKKDASDAVGAVEWIGKSLNPDLKCPPKSKKN